MISFTRSSINEILEEKRPSKIEYQSNKYKAWREAWLVARFCKTEGLNGLITAPYVEPVDTLLEIGNQKHLIQCVECKNEGPRGKPTDHPTEELKNGMLSFGTMSEANPYIDVHERIFKQIQNKAQKYGDISNIILLVYCNIYFSTEADLRIQSLQEKCKNIGFKSIYIREDGTNYHIKGQKIK